MPEHIAQPGELLIVTDRQHHVAVCRRKILIWNNIGVGITHPPWRLARGQVIHGLIRQTGYLHIQQRGLHILPLSRTVTVTERGEHTDRGIQPGHNVRQCYADLHRPGTGLPVRLPGDAHKPAHGLDQEIISGPVRVRAILAKPGDRTVDEFGVDTLQAFIVQAIALEATRFEVFKNDIRFCDQLSDQFLPFGMGDIDCEGLLVAIGGQEVGG